MFIFSLKISITNFVNKMLASIHPHTDKVGGRVSLFSDSQFAPKLPTQRPYRPVSDLVQQPYKASGRTVSGISFI